MNAVTALKRPSVILRSFAVCLFMYGQALSLSHAHEHQNDVQHSACEFCVLAVNDEEVLEPELGSPDVVDWPKVNDAKFVPLIDVQDSPLESLFFALYSQVKPLAPDRALKAVRAPPLH